MMDNGDLDKQFRPLNPGMLPPREIIVTLDDGRKKHIKIPYSGNHVIGLPLGLDVPRVIAHNYNTLLCMVNGMTSLITRLTVELEQQEKVAAHYFDDVNRYRLELEELKSTMGGGMAIPRAPVSPSKKRKRNTEESGPCNKCIEIPEHLLQPTSSDRSAIPALLVQESVIQEHIDESDGLPRAKHLRGENVATSASLTCSDMQTEKVESDAGVMPVGDSIDATMTLWTAQPFRIPTFESDDIPTFDCTTFSNPIDLTPPLIESTSVSSPLGNEWSEYVENFKIPKLYTDLYKKICGKYGHMVTKKVTKSSDAIRLVCITNLIKIAYAMETVRGVDLSAVLIENWEGDIKVAETLQFNIKWLSETFGRLKSSWKSSFSIDEEVESHEQVLDAEQVNYVGLISRKDELEKELVDVKINIRKSEAKISSEREAIRTKMAEKYIFLFDPVLGSLFS